MTFWGVEVKPGTPYTLFAEELNGTLCLTQATLGTGSAGKKSTLQVNVGENDPVFLCTLLPDKTESCSLNLEFDDDDDVKFSVVGPTSIHLAGYIATYHEEHGDDCDSDCDSDGEDIAEGESSDYDSEDYEDEFIDDDGDNTMLPPSPVRNSGVVIEELEDDEKAATENGGTKKSKKKKQLANNDKKAEKQIVKGDTGAPVLESEDEDGFPVSSSRKSENPEANTSGIAVEGKNKKRKKDDVESAKSLKEEVDAITGDEPKSDANEATNGDSSENKKKKQKKKKNKKAKIEKDEEVSNIMQNASTEDKQISKTDKVAKQSKSRVKTFPNGLVIEDVAMGKPDGKRASRGTKVSVRYVGKLQKNGKQFDATGSKPFKFRLGIGSVIKGWDVGVEGMRIGDKRKLTIPPSMGYGASGAPPQIPPNAWLVFDVELVDVA